MPFGRVERPVHPPAVALPGAQARDVEVPDVETPPRDGDSRLAPVLVEEAKVHAVGVLAEKREVDAVLVPPRAERVEGTGLNRERSQGPIMQSTARFVDELADGGEANGEPGVALERLDGRLGSRQLQFCIRRRWLAY